VRSVPKLYNEEQLHLRECLETAVRRVGGWCEIATSPSKSLSRVSQSIERERVCVCSDRQSVESCRSW
jgi:hypothetical protein